MIKVWNSACYMVINRFARAWKFFIWPQINFWPWITIRFTKLLIRDNRITLIQTILYSLHHKVDILSTSNYTVYLIQSIILKIKVSTWSISKKARPIACIKAAGCTNIIFRYITCNEWMTWNRILASYVWLKCSENWIHAK